MRKLLYLLFFIKLLKLSMRYVMARAYGNQQIQKLKVMYLLNLYPLLQQHIILSKALKLLWTDSHGPKMKSIFAIAGNVLIVEDKHNDSETDGSMNNQCGIWRGPERILHIWKLVQRIQKIIDKLRKEEGAKAFEKKRATIKEMLTCKEKAFPQFYKKIA